jgi:hypothetical protein
MSDLLITLVIVYSIATGFFCAGIAESKGRDNIGWFFLGLFFNIIALVAIAGIPSYMQGWRCNDCHLWNKLKDTVCDNCGTPKK